MPGLIDWESCNARRGRACHRLSAPGTRSAASTRHPAGSGTSPRGGRVAEFAILRPVSPHARHCAATVACRRSARRSSMDRTSAS